MDMNSQNSLLAFVDYSIIFVLGSELKHATPYYSIYLPVIEYFEFRLLILDVCLQCELLGEWNFKSRAHNTDYQGYMFPLLVQEQLAEWPEKNVRSRKWVCTFTPVTCFLRCQLKPSIQTISDFKLNILCR